MSASDESSHLSLTDIRISEVNIRTLIDNGSTANLISIKIYNLLQDLYPLHKINDATNCRAANGSEISLLGVVYVNIQIGRHNYPTEFYVSQNFPKEFDAIIGHTFLAKHDYILAKKNNKQSFILNGDEIPLVGIKINCTNFSSLNTLIYEHPNQVTFKVCEKVKVQPETIVFAQLQSVNGIRFKGTFLIEEYYREDGLYVPGQMQYFNGEYARLCVYNLYGIQDIILETGIKFQAERVAENEETVHINRIIHPGDATHSSYLPINEKNNKDLVKKVLKNNTMNKARNNRDDLQTYENVEEFRLKCQGNHFLSHKENMNRKENIKKVRVG